MTAVAWLLVLVAVPVGLAVSYLVILTAASRRGPELRPAQRSTRFAVVVPAHNESVGITRTVESLRGLDWPMDQYRVVVVADNCDDDTAARAESAGASVLVRRDEARRGKGYALAYAFEALLSEGWADAVVIIDADTTASTNLLEAMAGRLEIGAQAVQADYAVQNPSASWRTRLIAIALGMFHVLRSRGRERLGWSCGLRGNGMGFSARVLRDVPHDAFSVVEDVEYGIRLGLAGFRVSYVGEAHVYGEMVSGEKASRSQRQRWEGGRKQVARQVGAPLLAKALVQRSPMLMDLALDVLVPPLSTLVISVAVGIAASAGLGLAGGPWMAPAVLWVTLGLGVSLYVARGWALSGTGARGLVDLAYAPLYIGWKVALSIRGGRTRRDDWVRTTRESGSH